MFPFIFCDIFEAGKVPDPFLLGLRPLSDVHHRNMHLFEDFDRNVKIILNIVKAPAKNASPPINTPLLPKFLHLPESPKNADPDTFRPHGLSACQLRCRPDTKYLR